MRWGNAILPVERGGHLFIAIYNDQGLLSDFWKWVKRIYCTGIAWQAHRIDFLRFHCFSFAASSSD